MPESAQPEEVPADLLPALRAAIASDFPDGPEFRIRLCGAEPQRIVVRVVFNVPDLMPKPYVIYSFDKVSRVGRKLTGDEAAPFRIPNYK